MQFILNKTVEMLALCHYYIIVSGLKLFTKLLSLEEQCYQNKNRSERSKSSWFQQNLNKYQCVSTTIIITQNVAQYLQ